MIAAAALAAIGSFVALVAASIRSARLPLPALLRETTEPRTLSRTALILQSGIVLLTIAVLWTLATAPVVNGLQISLLAPVLVALLAGILGLRITVAVFRATSARAPRSLASAVIGRRLARAPSTLNGAVMVGVGIALAAYVLQLASVGARLEERRADAALGASTVLQVAPRPGVDLISAVRAADPGGRTAMAVEIAGGVGRLDLIASSPSMRRVSRR